MIKNSKKKCWVLTRTLSEEGYLGSIPIFNKLLKYTFKFIYLKSIKDLYDINKHNTKLVLK